MDFATDTFCRDGTETVSYYVAYIYAMRRNMRACVCVGVGRFVLLSDSLFLFIEGDTGWRAKQRAIIKMTLLGVKYRVFKDRVVPNLWNRTVFHLRRFEERLGVFKLGAPLFATVGICVYVGTEIMDQQFEVRD